MSENEKKYRIGNGLPRCIGSGADGFERLKSRLGLNRSLCKGLLEIDLIRKKTRALREALSRRRLRPGERDRTLLFALYRDSTFRRIFWKLSYGEAQTNQNESETESSPIPSLEQSVLANYTPDSASPEGDAAKIDEVFAEWPDLVQYLKDVPWAGSAAHAWSEVRKDLDSWGELDDEQRRQAALTAFAVATIVDDERILRAAVEKVPELKTEFGDVLNKDDDSGTADHPAEEKEEDVLSRWNELCGSLQILAEKAGGAPPIVDALTGIAQVVGDLEAIAPSVRDHLEKSSFENLVSHLKGLLGKLDAAQVFSWLDDGLREQLYARWQEKRQSLSPVQVREEFKRLDAEVPVAVEQVRKIAATLSDATHRIDSLRTEEPTDFFARHSWEETFDKLEEQVRNLRSEHRQAQMALLSRLSPLGETFEPSPDDSGSPPTTTKPAEEPVVLPPSATDGKQPTGQAEKIEGPDAPGVATDDTSPVDPKPAEPGASSQRPEAGPPEPEGDDKAADPLAARALTRMVEALLESPPRIAYAVQVGRLLDRLEIPIANQTPVALFEAALLSDHLCLPDGAVAAELGRVFAQFPPSEQFSDGPSRDLYVMLALSGVLRPALLAPQPNALAFLTALKPSERLGAVYQLASGVAEKSRKLQGVRIDSTVLRVAGSEAVWEEEHEKLRSEAAEWHEHARHKTIKYAPATKVWQRWLKPGGRINQLMTLIASDKSDDDAPIDAIPAELVDRREFEKLVKKTDRKEIGRSRGRNIQADALGADSTSLHGKR